MMNISVEREKILQKLDEAYFNSSVHAYLDIKKFITDFYDKEEETYAKKMEGIKNAQERGVRFGKKRIQKPDNYLETYTRWEKKEISSRTASKLLGISQATFLKWCREEQDSIKEQRKQGE